MRVILFVMCCIFMPPLTAQQSDFKNIDFTQADQIAQRHQGAALYNIPLLAHNLTFQLDTEVEKFRAIYYWVTHNIENDANLVDKNEYRQKKYKATPERLAQWNKTFKREVFNKLRAEKKTLCTGYAFLIQTLAQQSGLDCNIINGYGLANKSRFKNLDAPNHSWNTVKLNGKWYVCDATWSSGYTDETGIFVYDYDDRYFLMEVEEFGKSHLVGEMGVEW
ncbi:hypothetical protein EAX61_01290 [Dokdonia sinensis]|uniref:Transglutaminase-like domain-containing protein n=1 Tax=Dokdonia sinensis TaxID=2479847 RepID=A0A3M0GQR1_9FLAO|nr:transglutaminase domain-containing protein [Dokdonia sinensis]RMB64043.1 hypothetical protein EAX61_01290 [Dokdonia sinensis]